MSTIDQNIRLVRYYPHHFLEVGRITPVKRRCPAMSAHEDEAIVGMKASCEVPAENRTITEQKSTKQMHKNVLLVSLCWAFGIGAAFIQLSTSALVAVRFVGTSFSTVPVGLLFLMGCGSALFVPRHQNRYGGGIVYTVATAVGMVGALIQSLAVQFHSNGLSNESAMVLLVLGSALQGYVYACTTRCRLLVTEFATKDFLPTAVSLVIGGGTIGALIGPLLARVTADMTSVKFAGTYIHVMILYFLFHITVYFIDFKRTILKSMGANEETDDKNAQENNDNSSCRSLRELIRYKEYVVLILIQAISYSTMAGLMLGTPLAMTEDLWDFDRVQVAMMLHLFGMFLPSFVTGKIISKIGSYETASLGFVILLLGAGILLTGMELAVFYCGITLIGIGWNLSFVAASALVITTYSSTEKSVAESCNDTVVLISLGIVAVFSGSILDAIGWRPFVIFFMAFASPAFILTVWTVKTQEHS